MTATRTLTALFALTLLASTADAQVRTPGPATKTNVQLPKPQVNRNPSLASPAALQIPAGVKDRLNAADLAVTAVQVQADDTVRVTVKNVGRSATAKTVRLFVGTSGTGNLDNLADTQSFDIPVLAAGETRTFTTNRFLVKNARDEVDGPGLILVAAFADKNEQLAEPVESNNVMVISVK